MVQYSGTVYDSEVRIEGGKRGSGSGVVYVIPQLASGQHCSVTSIIVVGSTSQEYSVYRLQYYYVTSEPTANTTYTQTITHKLSHQFTKSIYYCKYILQIITIEIANQIKFFRQHFHTSSYINAHVSVHSRFFFRICF